LVVALVLAALLVLGEAQGTRPLSAVLVFLQVEVVANLSAVAGVVLRVVGGGGGGGAPLGLLGLLSYASAGYGKLQAVRQDAVLFAFTYLVAVRVLRVYLS
jgi:hypothetical protein